MRRSCSTAIRAFNADPAVDAYLVQLPLPKHLDEEQILLAVDPDKDVDGLHPVNLGRLVMGAPGPLPCTPAGIVALLAAYERARRGRHVVVIGRGLTIGRPLALLLALSRPHCNAAVTVVHTGVADLASYTLDADVIVAAAGSAALVTAEMVRRGPRSWVPASPGRGARSSPTSPTRRRGRRVTSPLASAGSVR